MPYKLHPRALQLPKEYPELVEGATLPDSSTRLTSPAPSSRGASPAPLHLALRYQDHPVFLT